MDFWAREIEEEVVLERRSAQVWSMRVRLGRPQRLREGRDRAACVLLPVDLRRAL